MQELEIFEIVECMTALIRSQERRKCTELRLQLVHYEVLNYLSYSNKYTNTPAATASHFGMTRGTVSQSLIMLEKKGYLEKKQDENDKRIVHVKLLPLGLALLKKARRTALFGKANKLLKVDNSVSVKKDVFINVLNALRKVSQSQSFNAEQIQKTDRIKKITVFDVIDSMAVLIRSEERRRCTVLKLQLVHFQVLKYLFVCNKYSDTPAAIANYLGMTRGTVSQTLILLEKRGFIEKIQDQIDKRVFHIQLLKKGFSTYHKVQPTELFEKAAKVLEKESSIMEGEKMFVAVLTALQKANNSQSFSICGTCKYFMKTPSGFLCGLTEEKLSKRDSEKICQEHVFI